MTLALALVLWSHLPRNTTWLSFNTAPLESWMAHERACTVGYGIGVNIHFVIIEPNL
jgi:hypothetical protein